MGGDINKRKLGPAINDFPGIKKVTTGPTRGKNVLDVLYTVLIDNLVDAGVTDPIYNKEGTPSNYGVVFAAFRMPRVYTESTNMSTL